MANDSDSVSMVERVARAMVEHWYRRGVVEHGIA